MPHVLDSICLRFWNKSDFNKMPQALFIRGVERAAILLTTPHIFRPSGREASME